MKAVKARWAPLLAMAGVVALALVAIGCGGSTGGGLYGGGGATTSAPSGGGGATTSGAVNGVVIENFAFTPQKLAVKVGTKVTWANKDSVPHTVVSTNNLSTSAATTNLFASNTLGQGQTFSFTFTKAGTYFYECSIHFSQPSMHGEVIVQ
jgi:plastocyanin